VDTTDGKVRVTHPFHPQRGHELEVVCRRRDWGEDRIVYAAPSGALRSIAAGLTDAAPRDEFQRVADGRSAFGTVDLIALCRLLDRLDGGNDA
jgi:hypothetical protein